MLFSQLINCFRPEAGINIFFIRNAWVVLAVELERHVPYADIFCVIISKFRYR